MIEIELNIAGVESECVRHLMVGAASLHLFVWLSLPLFTLELHSHSLMVRISIMTGYQENADYINNSTRMANNA
jgi:hypothetical protein